MEKETTGIVVSVSKQWWLKVNRKSLRTSPLDGADFPHIIKVKYTVDGKDYISKKWINPGTTVPNEQSKLKVFYHENKPSKSRIEI